MSKANFELVSTFKPKGDQPKAIEALLTGLREGRKEQVLLGVTGSGKTFTVANVIARWNQDVIVISHNKTLASQLYSEFKEFFPNNNVEYYISYFDFYRPEAYLAREDLYINKVSAVNREIEALRLASLNSLSRRSERTIVVASVAAIYGTMEPTQYNQLFFEVRRGQELDLRELLNLLVQRGYERNQLEQAPGSFLVRGDAVEISLSWNSEFILRIEFFDNIIESIVKLTALNREKAGSYESYTIYPAREYQVGNRLVNRVVKEVFEELKERLNYFEREGKIVEAERLRTRVKKDMDDLQEFGSFKGIENYSRFFDGRKAGERPFTLFDFLPDNGLIIIDESHIMVPQVGGMFQGDYSRKKSLVDYGFRLPSALDNRPLNAREFDDLKQQRIYVSATPGDLEVDRVEGEIVRQIVRPTGLLEPTIEVRSKEGQMEDIYDQIKQVSKLKERTLVLTTTKRAAEEISRFFQERGIRSAYLHSDYKTFERDEILRKLRKGIIDVIVGINLLREGIDLPEVSLICVLDADEESFLRNWRSLVQISGRAARNDHGKVILYADRISESMRICIEDNKEKRELQLEYNKREGIVPKSIVKPIHDSVSLRLIAGMLKGKGRKREGKDAREELIKELRKRMLRSAKEREYEEAARLRDMIIELSVDEG